MASISTFVNEVAAITLAGTRRNYIYPPKQITDADLPASFVMPPANTHAIIASCDDVGDTFTVRLVVAIQSAAQNLQSTNFATLLTMMDTLNQALKDATFTDMLPHNWTLQPQTAEPVVIESSAYWAVTATITAQGAG